MKLEPPKTAAGAIDWAAVQPGGIPGYVHFPSGLPDDVFDQITAEKRVTRYLRGQPRVEWVLEKGRRNEALDCAGMADAAAEYSGRSRLNWDQLERAINPAQQDLLLQAAKVTTDTGAATESDTAPEGAADAAPAPAVQTSARQKYSPPPRRRGGFVKNW